MFSVVVSDVRVRRGLSAVSQQPVADRAGVGVDVGQLIGLQLHQHGAVGQAGAGW